MSAAVWDDAAVWVDAERWDHEQITFTPTPPERTYVVAAESRTVFVPADLRLTGFRR